MPAKLYTLKELIDLYKGLLAIQNEKLSRRLSYGISRNIAKLEPVMKTFNAHIKEIGEVEGYRDKLKKIGIKYSKKGENGDPIKVGGSEDDFFIADITKFNAAAEKLKRDTGEDKKEEERQKLLDSKEEITLFLVDYDELPEEWTSVMMRPILPMIKEPEGE